MFRVDSPEKPRPLRSAVVVSTGVHFCKRIINNTMLKF